MAAQLVALQGVVLAVDGGRRMFVPGDPLPAMPDDQAARLVRLGAARAVVAEGAAAPAAEPVPASPARGKKAKPPAPAEGAAGPGA